MNSKQIFENYFALADVRIDGNRPWDIQVHNTGFYSRVLAGGSLALGESYMDGWWDCQQLDEFFSKVLCAELDKQVRSKSAIWGVIRAKLMNLQSRKRAYEVGKKHYDIGNELYEVMLDKNMAYSCGYWDQAGNLDQAQEAKLDLSCRKLGLKKGMKVLDIGSGWGSFAKYAAEKYGVEVVGITISEEQVKLAIKRGEGLPVEYRLQDYRLLNEQFDRIISIGMIEHVGEKNYSTYMGVAHRCLKSGGLFLLHTIGGNRSVSSTEPWIDKYIFPNSMLPSVKQLAAAAEKLFVLEDWHSFGTDYDKTLLAWYDNFTRGWEHIKGKYDQRFYRMWEYYLLSSAGSFRSRKNQLWQIVFSKEGVEGGYQSIR
ncbi:MAG: cyclopropane fatty acyl phospholipid synthase [Gammaproteobacteria bacterium]|nr:MAG: cyclopropane fatty acyl phospholipid synthase [Gammaproteobacteria bacterium]